MSVQKKIQPNRSSRQHIYTNVLFYYIDNISQKIFKLININLFLNFLPEN